MAFLILFEEGLRNLRDAQIVSQGPLENWVPIGGDIVQINVERKTSRERRKLEGLDLGMQELRTYFRLFLLSTFLLMFMFCTRISKNRNRDSGNVFDPWIPKKYWLELATELIFGCKSDCGLLHQMDKGRERFRVRTEFYSCTWLFWSWRSVYFPRGGMTIDEAGRIKVVSSCVFRFYSK